MWKMKLVKYPHLPNKEQKLKFKNRKINEAKVIKQLDQSKGLTPKK